MDNTISLDELEGSAKQVNAEQDSSCVGFPFSIPERFRYVKRLGVGGSGLVFQAFDTVIQRNVALKFLTQPTQANRARLLDEARAQADVEHSYVCPIYEVNESENGIYLVMKYIEGGSLANLAADLSLPQVLAIFKKVAEGLEVAHNQGLIHRDLKPANIMINKAEDELEPLIVDFGLAYYDETLAQDKKGLKTGRDRSGSLGFIAPEVFISNKVKADKRTDIYSFGASLLVATTGGLHQGKTEDALQNYLAKSNLPKDIQILIAKAMHRDADQRFQSAREVAAELERYLSGEPILSRAGKRYWLSKKLKKHWLPVSLLALILFVVFGAVAYQVHQKQLQEVREQALLDFNDQLKKLEYQSQLTFMLPRHDLESEQQAWRIQLDQLKASLASVPENLIGVTHYAIGRMYQVLAEHQSAIGHLSTSYQLEPNSDNAFYLAISHGAVYNEQLQQLLYIGDKATRERKLDALNTKLQNQVIEPLRANINAAEYRVYAEALLLYYQKDWQGALAMLNVRETLPTWFYLDDVLLGDIYLAQAVEKIESGEQSDVVGILLQQAWDNYQYALTVAPSDPSLFNKPLYVKSARLLDANQTGRAVTKQMVEEIKQYEALLANEVTLLQEQYQLFGQLYHLYGLNTQHSKEDAAPWFIMAESHFAKAQEVAPPSNLLWVLLGQHHVDVAKHQMEIGGDPESKLIQANLALKQIPDEYQGYEYWSELATINRYLALEKRKKGEGSEHFFQTAIDHYLAAVNFEPNRIGGLINAATTLRKGSETKDLETRKSELLLALTWLKQALDKQANHFVANYYNFMIHVDLLELALYQQAERPSRELQQAEVALESLKSVNNSHPFVLDLELKLRQLELEYQFISSDDWPEGFMQLADRRIDLAKKFPNNAIVNRNLVGVFAWVVGVRMQLELDPSEYLSKFSTILQEQQKIEDEQAFRALHHVYSNWRDPEQDANAIIEKYALNDATGFTYDWAKGLILIEQSCDSKSISQGVALITENKGLLPFYKAKILASAKRKLANKSGLCADKA